MLHIHVYDMLTFTFSKPDMQTWLVVPEGEEIVHPGDNTFFLVFFFLFYQNLSWRFYFFDFFNFSNFFLARL